MPLFYQIEIVAQIYVNATGYIDSSPLQVATTVSGHLLFV